jgi:hypothetical protein
MEPSRRNTRPGYTPEIMAQARRSMAVIFARLRARETVRNNDNPILSNVALPQNRAMQEVNRFKNMTLSASIVYAE